MEASEAMELVGEEEDGGAEKREKQTRLRGALTVSVLAMMLAISSLGGSNSAKTSMAESIDASDTFNFFQAKNGRQNQLKIAIDGLNIELLREPEMAPPARDAIQGKIAEYRAKVAELESEPATGEGKKELLAKARAHEAARDLALRQDPWFDVAEGGLQIAIVLVSVSLIIAAPGLYWLGLLAGLAGALAGANGYFLWL